MHGLKCAPTSHLWTCHCLQAQEFSHAWFNPHLNMNPLIRMSVNTEKRIMGGGNRNICITRISSLDRGAKITFKMYN